MAKDEAAEAPGVAGWQADVPSPCIGVCELDAATGWCKGCWRSIAEIASWPRLDAAEKRRLIAALHERSAAPAPRR